LQYEVASFSEHTYQYIVMPRKKEPLAESFGFEDDRQDASKLSGAQFRRGNPGVDTEGKEFSDILKDWQLKLKISEPEKMVSALSLDINGGISAADWQALLLGDAAPSPRLIQFLETAYRQSMSGQSKVKSSVFEGAAFASFRKAREGTLSDHNVAIRIISTGLCS